MTYKKASISAPIRIDVLLLAGAIPGRVTLISCYYCGSPGLVDWPCHEDGRPMRWIRKTPGLELDHVIPEVLGGPTIPGNLVAACRLCNRSPKSRPDHPLGYCSIPVLLPDRYRNATVGTALRLPPGREGSSEGRQEGRDQFASLTVFGVADDLEEVDPATRTSRP